MTALQIKTGLQSSPGLTDEDLQYFASVIFERSGILLKAAKHDLIKTRLRTRLLAHELNDYAEYRMLLQKLAKTDPEWEIFVNLLTTNKTDFFREAKHFDYLTEKIIPIWLKSDQQTFKVWSAASSTGEEAYTLSMILSKVLPPGKDFRILATDIDTEVIKTAQNAVYSMAKKPEIPVEYHQSCIDIGQGPAKGWFRIKPHLKEKVTFKQHNLMEKTSPGEGVFDLVLCRNVLIYFGTEGIDFVQKKLYSSVKKGGHLFIGHSESLQGISHQWKSVDPSVFKRES